MILGALFGAALSVVLLLADPTPRLPRLLVVILVKLTLLTSFGLMAAGAVLQRLANRADEQARLLDSPEEDR